MAGKTYVGTRSPMSVERWQELGWSKKDAIGLAQRHQREPTVTVVTEDGAHPLEHHVMHSPTGFEWGYGGSGPADTARCILIDYFGDESTCGACSGTGTETTDPEDGSRCFDCDGTGITLPVSYQQFKSDVIAPLDRDGFIITSESIAEWVARVRK